MEIQKSFSVENRTFTGICERPNICPMCQHALKPTELHSHAYYDDKRNLFLTVLYLCENCFRTFVTLHACEESYQYRNYTYTSNLLYCKPSLPSKQDFCEHLIKISPRFPEIYNQAKAAEEHGLNEICGLGYRKALEFLIKDYAVHKEPDPDKQNEILNKNLSACIKIISDADIEKLASRCAWFGNDEAHYIKRFDEYGIDTLKTLLNSTVYFISHKLTAEFAGEIEPRR